MNFVVLNLNKYILVKIVDLILFNLVCLCRSISANKIKIQPINRHNKNRIKKLLKDIVKTIKIGKQCI